MRTTTNSKGSAEIPRVRKQAGASVASGCGAASFPGSIPIESRSRCVRHFPTKGQVPSRRGARPRKESAQEPFRRRLWHPLAWSMAPITPLKRKGWCFHGSSPDRGTIVPSQAPSKVQHRKICPGKTRVTDSTMTAVNRQPPGVGVPVDRNPGDPSVGSFDGTFYSSWKYPAKPYSPKEHHPFPSIQEHEDKLSKLPRPAPPPRCRTGTVDDAQALRSSN